MQAAPASTAPTGRRAWTLPEWSLPLWVVALALLIMAPLLKPGYVLNLDMVFVPEQSLQPWMLGLDGGLPRAVPQDGIVALLAGPIPGQLLQKVALLGFAVLAGLGVARVLADQATGIRMVAATVYLWNGYVAERLVMGNWSLLLALAAAPWLLVSIMRARGTRAVGRAPAWVGVLGWTALASWVPSGGVLALVLGVALLLPGATRRWPPRVLTYVGVWILNLPWIVPSLLHPASGAASNEGLESFALRADGPWGALVTGLSLGGTWNADVVPTSRQFGLGLVLVVGLIVLSVFGVGALQRLLGRALASYLGILAAGSLILAAGTGTAVGRWFLVSVPGAGILRDAQKPLVLLGLWFSLAAPLGLAVLLGKGVSVTGRRVILALALLGPLMLLPELAWGAFGRLAPVDYPASWAQLRQEVARNPGDVASLPWSTFRRYGWNGGRTVVDPLPRYLDRTVVVDTGLLVYQSAKGEYLRVPGDDDRSEAIARAIELGRPLAEALPGLGVTQVVVQLDQPTAGPPANLRGMTRVWRGGDLELWTIGVPPTPWPQARGAGLVVAANLVAMTLLAVAAVVALVTCLRGPKQPPDP